MGPIKERKMTKAQKKWYDQGFKEGERQGLWRGREEGVNMVQKNVKEALEINEF